MTIFFYLERFEGGYLLCICMGVDLEGSTMIVTQYIITFYLSLSAAYNPIIRQHKSSALQITSLLPTPYHLVAGTSSGAVLTLPVPPLDHAPHSLLLEPVPAPLAWGHVDPVHFLASIKQEDKTLVVTGGNGCENFVSMKMSEDVPDTSSCLLLWSQP